MSSKPFLPLNQPLASQRSVRIRWVSFRYYTPLKRLSTYVSNYLDGKLSLADAADIAGLSTVYFAEYFREKTGATFKYWIDFLRIAKAAKLVKGSDLQIREIAENCGFADTTTFTRTFRRVLNRTPMQFRRETDLREGLIGPKKCRKIPNNRRKNPTKRRF